MGTSHLIFLLFHSLPHHLITAQPTDVVAATTRLQDIIEVTETYWTAVPKCHLLLEVYRKILGVLDVLSLVYGFDPYRATLSDLF
jgi:hypothetical protein